MLTHQEVKRRIIDYMEQIRYEQQLTQEQMAKKLNLSSTAYKDLIADKTKKIDIYYLYLALQLSPTKRCLLSLLGLSDSRNRLLEKLIYLSPSQQAFIAEIIDFEYAFLQRHTTNASEYISVLVPSGNEEDGMLWDSANIEKVNIAPLLHRYPDQIVCGIKITSNHLHPVYVKGDILLIDRRPPRDGDTGIFINKETGCAYIRKFHQSSPCFLEPINGLGKPLYVDSDSPEDMAKWIKFGYVLTKVRQP